MNRFFIALTFIVVIMRVGYLQLSNDSTYKRFYVNTLHAYYKRLCIVKGIGSRTATKIPLKEIYNPNSSCDTLINSLMNKAYEDHQTYLFKKVVSSKKYKF